MQLLLTSFLCSFSCVMTCSAQMATYQCIRDADGNRQLISRDPSMLSPQSGFKAYDNWRTSSEGGHVQYRGGFATGTDEYADDLIMRTRGPAQLSDLAYTIFNASQTGTLTHYRETLRFYDTNFSLLRLISFVDTIRIPPQSGIAIYSDGGFYRPFDLILPTQIYFSIQFSEVEGASPNDIGVFKAGPLNYGQSSQFVRNLTTGQQIDLDGSDQTNFSYFVDTVNLPAPGCASFLIAALPLLRRQRALRN